MKKSDILWYNSSTGETQVWYMDGHRVVGRGTVLGQNGNPVFIGPPFSIVGIGDMNGNGNADIVWHHSQTNETQVWYMDGHRVVGRGTVLGQDGNPAFIGPPFSIVGIGEFNPRPNAPTNLRVTNVAAGTVNLSWTDQSENEDGFSIRFSGKRALSSDHTGTQSVDRDSATASLTGLRGNYEYTISVVAFNTFGESQSSNEVRATTPNVAETTTVSLNRQVIVQGFVPYLGQFPLFGVVPAGRLLRIRLPQSGFSNSALSFLKPGHSTEECGNASAVVVIGEGQTTTSAQMMDIYGVAEPRFTTTAPIPFIACYSTDSAAIPNFVTIEIDVIYDMAVLST